MKRFAQALSMHIFIASTAIAAAIHSTWVIATSFGGLQPTPEVSLFYAGWLLPGVLIAFSLDIGMLATAAAIRNGQRTKRMYVTFAVLATFIFLMQAMYLSAHTPVIAIAPGVNDWLRGIVQFFMDLRVVWLPLMLPLSTTLYTFSYDVPATPQQGRKSGQGATNRDDRRATIAEDMESPPVAEIVSPNGNQEVVENEIPLLARFGRKRHGKR